MSGTAVSSKVNAGIPLYSSAMYAGKASAQGPSHLYTVETGPPRHNCWSIDMQSATLYVVELQQAPISRGPLIDASCDLMTLGMADCMLMGWHLWRGGPVSTVQRWEGPWTAAFPMYIAEECKGVPAFTLEVTVVALIARFVWAWCLQCNMSRLNSD